MAKEIERKFLVNSKDYQLGATKVYMCQAYLMIDKLKVVRVRISGEKAFLTIKSSVNGISRDEYEYPIPVEDAEAMMKDLKVSPPVEKYRYYKEIGGKTWEIDEFLGANKGLVVAEIELNAEDEAFEKPEWAGEEVSQDKKYFNAYLSMHPFSEWKEEE